MGAASSINITDNFEIYISYPEKNNYIDCFQNVLKKNNYTVIDSSIILNSKDIPFENISKYVETILQKTKYIFVCVSPYTIKTITQIIEMNEIIDQYLLIKDKIIYFMIDPKYTPITNKELNTIIKDNKWFNLYDKDSLFYTTNKILEILMTN